MVPAAYRTLLQDRRTRLLLTGLGASSLGDGLSTVTIAWLAVRIAPASEVGLFVGLAVAAYTLPGVIGAVAFGRLLRGRPARAMLLGHCLLRTGCLGGIALLYAAGMLAPHLYVILLAGSSLMTAWGTAGQYKMLSELGGPEGRLAVNALASAQSRSPPSLAHCWPGWPSAGSARACCSPSMPRHSRSSASLPGAPARRRRLSGSRSMRGRSRDSGSSGARIC
jgi:MFS family permease